ncbi:MAG: response regulator [Gammaproteobacteria bacterium]|nr:response regulator [Gammaproteobacteria bacterium]
MATIEKQTRETGKIIFVVDSDSALRQRLMSVLQNSSQDVKTFEKAENLLVQLDVTMPDCLIIGTKLSGMGAIDLMYQLKKQEVDIPAIVLSEEADISQAVSAMRAGAVDFINKPFTDQKLRVCVKRILEKAS